MIMEPLVMIVLFSRRRNTSVAPHNRPIECLSDGNGYEEEHFDIKLSIKRTFFYRTLRNEKWYCFLFSGRWIFFFSMSMNSSTISIKNTMSEWATSSLEDEKEREQEKKRIIKHIRRFFSIKSAKEKTRESRTMRVNTMRNIFTDWEENHSKYLTIEYEYT